MCACFFTFQNLGLAVLTVRGDRNAGTNMNKCGVRVKDTCVICERGPLRVEKKSVACMREACDGLCHEIVLGSMSFTCFFTL